jgi:hypothetical protein
MKCPIDLVDGAYFLYPFAGNATFFLRKTVVSLFGKIYTITRHRLGADCLLRQFVAESALKLEIHKQPSKIFAVVFYTVVHGLDMGLLQEPLYFFAQLATALTGNNLHFPYFLLHGVVKGLL